MIDFSKEMAEFATIADFLRFGVSQAAQADLFYGHGCDNAWDDMLMLVLMSLHLPLDMDKSLLQAKLSPVEKNLLIKQFDKRINHNIPVPYLTNHSVFCGLDFYVDERVLIPRSPIAELIEKQFTPWVNPEKVTRVLDMCTGSACIAIACCYAFDSAWVDAVDLSADALTVAQINSQHHGLSEQLSLIQSDLFKQLPQAQYDIIVSNPPYVGDEEMASLPHEYCHEPDMALRAAENGLALVDDMLAQAHDYLTDDGILVVEVGNSEQALIEKYPQLPFLWLEFERGGSGVFLLTKQQLAQHC